jgi:hypothetical protein
VHGLPLGTGKPDLRFANVVMEEPKEEKIRACGVLHNEEAAQLDDGVVGHEYDAESGAALEAVVVPGLRAADEMGADVDVVVEG